MKGVVIIRNRAEDTDQQLDEAAARVLDSRWGRENWKKTGQKNWKAGKTQLESFGMRVRIFLHSYGFHYKIMIEEIDAQTGVAIHRGFQCFICYLMNEAETIRRASNP